MTTAITEKGAHFGRLFLMTTPQIEEKMSVVY